MSQDTAMTRPGSRPSHASFDLEGRVVVVTGGHKGIGRAAVLRLCAGGASVVFQGRSRDAAEETIEAASAVGTQPVFVAGDLYEYGTHARLVEEAVARFGRLDGAVGSGMSALPHKLFREMVPEDFAAYYDSGATPRLYLLHAACGQMARTRFGKVVLVTTDAGRVPTPGESMIGATAASLVFLTKALGRELSRDGIRVNAVGVTLTKDTPGYERMQARRRSGTPESRIEDVAFTKLEARMPFGLGSADEVGDLITYLVAPVSDGITGATISLNRGGYFPTYS